MVDTIKYIYNDFRLGVNLLDYLPKYFDVNGQHSYKNGDTLTGKLNNLYITVHKNSLKIENSLSKWYFGNNLQTLTKNQIKLANEKLSDTLHLNILTSKVLKLDIAENFPVNFSPKNYFSYFGKLNRYIRLEQPDGIYYKQKNKEVLFYDKLKEQKAKGFEIPSQFNNTNLLRYEMKFTHNISKELKEAEITPVLLSDDIFFDKLINKYLDVYFNIEKQKEYNLYCGSYKGIKGLNEAGVVFLINQIGTNNLLKQINVDYSTEKITIKEKRGMINKIRHINDKHSLMIDSPLMNELNQKIRIITTGKFD